MMTLTQFRELVAPLVQWPLTLRLAPWLGADRLEWSLQYPGVLDAGPLAFRDVQRAQPELS